VGRSKRGRQRRKARQRLARRYTKAREDCQLAGDIETSPAGAVRSERVDPRTQGCQPLPGLVRAALRAGWATAADAAVRAVDELCAVVTDPDVEPHVKVTAVRVLLEGDRLQWERDHPEAARAASGSARACRSTTTPPAALELARRQAEALTRPDPLEEAKRRCLEEWTRRPGVPGPSADGERS
jgi:hypothetical protein